MKMYNYEFYHCKEVAFLVSLLRPHCSNDIVKSHHSSVVSGEETFWSQFDEAVGCATTALDSLFDSAISVTPENVDSKSSKRLARVTTKANTYQHKKKLASKQHQDMFSDTPTTSVPVPHLDENERSPDDVAGKETKTRTKSDLSEGLQKAKISKKRKSSSDQDTVKVQESEDLADKQSPPDIPKKHICEFCRNEYKSAAALKKHDCKAIICLYCHDKVYEDVDLLVEHVNDEHHACNVEDCDYYCDSANGLKYHFVNEHDTMPKYPCGKCGRVMKSNQTLANHVKKCKAVKKEATYFCEYCEELFPNSDQKNEHEVLCTQNPKRQHPCKLCGEIFNGLDALKNHLCNDHGEDFALCQFCHKGFKTAEALKCHQKQCPAKTEVVDKDKTVRDKRKTRSSGSVAADK